jgi:hypothetical protein
MKLPAAEHANLAATRNRAMSEVKMRLERRSLVWLPLQRLGAPRYVIVWDGSTGWSDSLGNEEQTTVNVVKQGA